MEWIRRMRLKKALFTMTFINLILATLLSVLSFWICLELSTKVSSHMVEIRINDDNLAVKETNLAVKETEKEVSPRAAMAGNILSALQIVLPVAYFVTAMMITASLFYRLKLKEPLELLARGASRIMENDLDFQVETRTEDELGELCIAFETMRRSLLNNNRELWRQAEERKRLNAAFSHDLRNPVTVIKGSVKMARRCLEQPVVQRDEAGKSVSVKQDFPDTELLRENLARIEDYTDRIRRYVEVMGSVGKLEEVQAERAPAAWSTLAGELENAISFIVAGSGIRFVFERFGSGGTICVDKNMLFQIAENLISNGLRFAKRQITVRLFLSEEELSLEVADDGEGFPERLLKNGVKPFQKGVEDSDHFGMGLYICDLLCRKHGGSLTLENGQTGAKVCAVLRIS